MLTSTSHACQQLPVRDDATAYAYRAARTQFLQTLRDPTNQRTVYWSGDGL